MSSLPFFLSGLWHEMQLALKIGRTSFSKLTDFLSWLVPSGVEAADRDTPRHITLKIAGASRIGRSPVNLGRIIIRRPGENGGFTREGRGAPGRGRRSASGRAR